MDCRGSEKRFCHGYCKPEFVMAEIGVYQGESTSWFAAACKTVHAIDPHPDSGVPTASSEGLIIDQRPILARMMFEQRCRIHKNVVYHRMTSESAISLFPDASLDLVYIDGDHACEAAKQDIILWKPKIKKGGFLSGHDYALKGVRQAITDTMGKPIEIFKDNSWVFEL